MPFSEPSLELRWPPLLVLTEVYTRSLLTMGDDEFFSEAPTAGGTAIRNPFSLDELAAFSRQLVNIVFPLSWHADELRGPVPGLRMSWECIRDKITRCLQSIHTRE